MMPKYVRLVLGLGFFFCVQEGWACHNFFAKDGTLGHLSGHKPKYSLNLTTQPTEVSTAMTLTSTQCDWYAEFVYKEYEQIAEQAAQGKGAHLATLAQLIGCPVALHDPFARFLQSHHQVLFTDSQKPFLFTQILQTELQKEGMFQKQCRFS